MGEKPFDLARFTHRFQPQCEEGFWQEIQAVINDYWQGVNRGNLTSEAEVRGWPSQD